MGEAPVVKAAEAPAPTQAIAPEAPSLAGQPGVPVQQGRATWYKRSRHTHTTATGEALDDRLFTAAHLTLPLGSFVRVIDTATGNSVIVRINDRGPYARDYIIDLSKSAADALGVFRNPRMTVSLELLASKPEADHLSVPISTLPTGAAALAALGGGKPKPGAGKAKPASVKTTAVSANVTKPVPPKAGATKPVKTTVKPAPPKTNPTKAPVAKTPPAKTPPAKPKPAAPKPAAKAS